jgi:hypothetical protein
MLMMVVGQMVLDMAMESTCGQMEISMSGIGYKIKWTGEEILSGLTVMLMMVVGQMVLDMAMESACGQMEISMRGIGQKIKWTGEEI